MHVFDPSIPDVSSTSPPIRQTGRDWEAALFALMERILAENDVPDDYAYRLALIRLNEEEAK